MNYLLQNIYLNHKNFWTKNNFWLFLQSIIIFIIAFFIKNFANNYVDRTITTPVGDLFLDNLPTINVNFFVIQGVLILSCVILSLFVSNPKYVPFALKSLSLFIVIRAFFIALTHLGVNLDQLVLDRNSFGFEIYDFLYNAKSDFFFSGHVGIPFLLAFIFWNKKLWRYIFFIFSFIFGTSMILAHMHYSIDIFSAPFITYTIFVISKKIFKSDFKLIQNY